MNRIFGPYPSGRAAAGLLLIRLVFGVGIVLHGWDKVVNGGPFHWADGMGPLAVIPPALQALATATEIGSGLAIIFGFLMPLATLGLAITMTVALILGHKGEPYVSFARPFGPTYELVAHYGIVALGLLFTGPGVVSLDYLLFGRRRPPEAVPVP
ncbi:MAG: DoxX family protein [Gluconacetobacter diazotrophicus]|nr:DoxX family protein [Gluconacetobacter diazotrophicus]